MQNGIYRYLFLFLFFGIFCSNFVLADDWANLDFSSRIPINITNLNVTNVPNFVQIIDLGYEAEMQTDFRDVVFYEGNNSLGFTQGQYLDSIHSEFYVRIPVLNASSTHTIYAYFNNATITSQSSVEDTFYYYDNFDSYNSSRYTSGGKNAFGVENGYLKSSTGDGLVYDYYFSPTKNILFVMGNFYHNTTSSYSYQKVWGLGTDCVWGSSSCLGFATYEGIADQTFMRKWDSSYNSTAVNFLPNFKSDFLNYEILLYDGFIPSMISMINSSSRVNLQNYTMSSETFVYDNYFGLSIGSNIAQDKMLLDYYGIGNTTYPYPEYIVGTEEINIEPSNMTIVQSYPINDLLTNQTTLNFACNYTMIGGENLANVTLLITFENDTFYYSDTITGLSTKSYNATWDNINFTLDEDYDWFCYGGGAIGTTSQTNEYDLIIDTSLPILTDNSFNGTIQASLPYDYSLNYLSSDIHLSYCGYSTSDSPSEINISCNSPYDITFSSYGNKTVYFFAVDGVGNRADGNVDFVLEAIPFNPLDSNIIYNLFNSVGAGLGIFMNFVGYGLMILIPALVVVGIVLVLLKPIKRIFGTA